MSVMNAVVKLWDVERGFGFLRCKNGRDYFLHIKQWSVTDVPTVGTRVEFEIGPGSRGHKEQAINARPAALPNAGVHALQATKIETIEGVDVTRTDKVRS